MKRRNRYENNPKEIRIAVSGTIGAGKSTLVEGLGKYYGQSSETYKEIIDREMLDLFYKHMAEGGNQQLEELHQFAFLNNTIMRDIKSYYSDVPIKIYDRQIVEHVQIFAKKNLRYDGFLMYDFFQEMFLEQLGHKGYDLTILLVLSDEENSRRIYARGRDSETESNNAYFAEINKLYTEDYFLKELERYTDQLIIIDVTDMTQDEVLNRVTKHIREYQEGV